MTPEQKFGVGSLMLIGAVVVGYIVRCVVPARHFPRIAGLLAANATIAELAVAGIEPAAHMVIWVFYLSVYVGIHVAAAEDW